MSHPTPDRVAESAVKRYRLINGLLADHNSHTHSIFYGEVNVVLATDYEAAEARIAELEAELRLVASLGGKTLLGGSDMDSPELAYQHGAHAAFEQAADIAGAAIARTTSAA